MSNTGSLIKVILLTLMLQGCGSNGFHLRENVTLPSTYNKVLLAGESRSAEFDTLFADALSEAGGEIVGSAKQANSTIVFDRFEEGRRVIAYTNERRAREYLVFLKLEYSLKNNNETTSAAEPTKWRLNIDRSYLYDADFALGKAEEEKRVKQALYEEATRLILLRLKYSK